MSAAIVTESNTKASSMNPISGFAWSIDPSAKIGPASGGYCHIGSAAGNLPSTSQEAQLE